MTLVDVTLRVQQIQSQLAALSPPQTTNAAFADIIGGLTAERATPAAPTTSTPDASEIPATTDVEATGSSAGGVTGADVVTEAKKYLGVPYVWGGETPDGGMDCSGFIQYTYDQLGIELPRVSYEQAEAGRPVASLAEAQPGDILAFNSPVSHVGIYLGDNQMIHSPKPGEVVRVEDVYDTPTAIRRIVDEGTPAAGDAGSLSGTPYASLFSQEAAEHGLDPTLLAAIAKQESGYDPSAVSSAGAQGLMQLMPATADGLGVADPFDPAQAVDGAARLLKSLLAEFGRTDLALAAYNAGPGAVHRYDGIPPYPETQAYVPSVLAIQAALQGGS